MMKQQLNIPQLMECSLISSRHWCLTMHNYKFFIKETRRVFVFFLLFYFFKESWFNEYKGNQNDYLERYCFLNLCFTCSIFCCLTQFMILTSAMFYFKDQLHLFCLKQYQFDMKKMPKVCKLGLICSVFTFAYIHRKRTNLRTIKIYEKKTLQSDIFV